MNPLFPDEYWSEEFYIPNIICIVDDAVRRDVDGCQGAIGWRENKKGTEVLFLYDEFVEECGLKFVPAAICDEIYYVDTFDKKRFVKVDYIFRQAQEEKIAELENIAYSLGAKSCSIEIEQKEMQREKKHRNVSITESSAFVGKEGYVAESMSNNSVRVSGKFEAKFKGNDTVTRPNLKWFAYDDNIKNLVEYRCNGNNEITSKRLELHGASSTTMSRKAASSIDLTMAAMKMNQSTSIEELSVKESTSKIIFCLEF